MYDTPNVLESPCLTAGLSSPVRDVMLGSITLGDTTMQNLTAEDILAMIGQSSKKELDSVGSAEMYSNSNYELKKNRNKKENTFQQSSVNVRGQAPISSSQAQGPVVKEDREIPEDQTVGITEQKYGRRLNWQNDKIIEMRLQIGNVKIGDRYKRATAYISIKTETDKRYMIFMKSSMTTATDETFRSIKKDNDKVLQSVAEEFYTDHYDQKLFLGRVKYKITKGQKIQKHHRTNLPCALIGMWIDEGIFYARFHLLGDDYDFELTDDISTSQKKYYQYEGLWQCDEGPLSMNEAFGG